MAGEPRDGDAMNKPARREGRRPAPRRPQEGVALVTGGARGIGLAIGRTLSREGARIALVDRDFEAGAEPPIPGAITLRRDVREFEGAATAVAEVEDRFGPLTIAVLNAGISRDSASWRMSEQDWREVIEVNLTGAFAYAQAAARSMRETGGGAIVFVSSINALRGKFGLTNYSASKAGLIGLTRTLARELGPKQIRVNAVAPGYVRTELTSGLDPRFLAQAKNETALGRLGEPEDVAELVAFLASPRARHVTGEIVRVDGGQMA
jgi:NAD(P)-dependent dehydrogenase (short-subunit alcohol dehydrogenase family)